MEGWRGGHERREGRGGGRGYLQGRELDRRLADRVANLRAGGRRGERSRNGRGLGMGEHMQRVVCSSDSEGDRVRSSQCLLSGEERTIISGWRERGDEGEKEGAGDGVGE